MEWKRLRSLSLAHSGALVIWSNSRHRTGLLLFGPFPDRAMNLLTSLRWGANGIGDCGLTAIFVGQVYNLKHGSSTTPLMKRERMAETSLVSPSSSLSAQSQVKNERIPNRPKAADKLAP